MEAIKKTSPQLTPRQIAEYKGALIAQRAQAAMENEPFPNDRLTMLFIDSVEQALAQAAPYEARVSLDHYLDILRLFDKSPCEPFEISLFHFGTIANLMESTSRNKLNLGLSDYITVLEELAEHVKYWNQRLVEIKDAIEKEVGQEVLEKISNEKASMGPKMAEA